MPFRMLVAPLPLHFLLAAVSSGNRSAAGGGPGTNSSRATPRSLPRPRASRCPQRQRPPRGQAAPSPGPHSPRGPADRDAGGVLGAWLLGGVWAWAAGSPGAPRPCQAPQQWEGRRVLYRQSSGRYSRALLSYDGLHQRLRVLDERKALIPCKRLFEYILLYKDGVMFQIEQATKQCSKIALKDPWDPLDIPQNSTFEDQYSIGGPQEKVTVQEWSDRKSARAYETWIGIYTVKDCYPVQETFTKNYSVILSMRFFDVQLGIKDPSVFSPPSTCQTAQPEEMTEHCSE
ncbi:PREDICTED: LOW QUALITY PROTEIN: mammalian ependymin-related protein 1 [Galeopterus variegatus]|uniref:Mammalian ependymin-related protein 1 n=1 Tax=Galeopterus variegatus TaxID=482537 RepID=A0ABM0SAN5_GALVR|nr:PREDICTED: LOW QUALITY PROTEIN: mammalian ependymin-related protein 1 [Galeopterus variegatus]